MGKARVFPTAAQVRQLTVQLQMTVPGEWEDRNGHVNVQYYQTLYELGGYQILEEIGFADDWRADDTFGIFDLEHHLNYRAELIVGQRVSCYNRIVDSNARRFHGMYFIVNDTTDLLACTLEYVTAGVDLRTRKTCLLPESLRSGLSRLRDDGRKSGWEAPICGVMAC